LDRELVGSWSGSSRMNVSGFRQMMRLDSEVKKEGVGEETKGQSPEKQ